MALTDSLSCYYKFDENSGSVVSDSASTNTGIWQGNLGSQWAPGIINSGGSFDGSTNYVSTGTNIPAQSQVFSMSAWVKPVSFTGNPDIMTFNATGGEDFRISSVGNLVFSSLGNAVFATSIGTVPIGTLSHVAFTMDVSNNYAFYINGTVSGTANSVHVFDIAHNLFIGKEGGFTSFSSGIIDEVGYWTRALSAAEVLQLYNNGAGLQYPFLTGGGNMLTLGVNS